MQRPKIKIEKVYLKALDILSYELMLRTNDTQENWKSGAIKNAIWILADEEEEKIIAQNKTITHNMKKSIVTRDKIAENKR